MSLIEPNFSIDLSGQTALITGASSGLGRRFAELLAACGARVAVTARRIDRLDSLAADITRSGGRALAIQLDVGDADQLIAAMDKAEQELGPVTILVNNAGVANPGPATEMPVAALDDIIATNLRAPYILSTEFARRLIRAKLSGRIVNIASIAAFHCDGSGIGAYTMTKAGLVRMTEALAVEWAKFGINVNAIAPGAFHTEMIDLMLQHNPDFPKQFPRGRLGRCEQLDSSLLYLVSPSSELVTGTCIKVDDVQLGR